MWKNMFFLSLSWSQWSRTQTLVTKTQYCNASPCITGQSHIFQCDTACCPPASAVAAKSEDILSFHTSQQVQTILSKWMWLMSGCFKPFQSWWIPVFQKRLVLSYEQTYLVCLHDENQIPPRIIPIVCRRLGRLDKKSMFPWQSPRMLCVAEET